VCDVCDVSWDTVLVCRWHDSKGREGSIEITPTSILLLDVETMRGNFSACGALLRRAPAARQGGAPGLRCFVLQGMSICIYVYMYIHTHIYIYTYL
jgi:hypothetical protein